MKDRKTVMIKFLHTSIDIDTPQLKNNLLIIKSNVVVLMLKG